MPVELKGAFFSPGANAQVSRAIDQGRHQASQVALNRVRLRLDAVLENPTGYYESRIQVDQSYGDSDRIHDSNVIYGPWLEGVGSRNRTTRFKGYATFRLVRQDMERTAADLIRAQVAQAVGRIS